jgi:hypothetical protein
MSLLEHSMFLNTIEEVDDVFLRHYYFIYKGTNYLHVDLITKDRDKSSIKYNTTVFNISRGQ